MEYSEKLERDVKMQMELGYADFDVSLVRCLFAEIDRCHLELAKFNAADAMSKALIQRLENRKPEGD